MPTVNIDTLYKKILEGKKDTKNGYVTVHNGKGRCSNNDNSPFRGAFDCGKQTNRK